MGTTTNEVPRIRKAGDHSTGRREPSNGVSELGETGLQDRSLKPKHVWNRIPDKLRRKVVKLALNEAELSPRELAVTFTENEKYFVSEALTYRVPKPHDLITGQSFIVIKVADEFKEKQTRSTSFGKLTPPT